MSRPLSPRPPVKRRSPSSARSGPGLPGASAFESMPGPVLVLDRHGALLAYNRAWKRMADGGKGCPFPRTTRVGSNYLEACRHIDGDAVAKRAFGGIQNVLRGSLPRYQLEYACEQDKGTHWFLLEAVPLAHDDGGLVLTLHDITALKQLQAEQERKIKELEAKNYELDQMAIRDPLTGMYNRRFFDEVLAREWRRFQRTGEPFTVIIMDLDGFKTINDRYGHEAGDQALREVGVALRNLLRESDLVARVGGDEFAALLPRTDEDGAKPVTDKLRSSVKKLRVLSHQNRLAISLSFGAATVPGYPPASSAAELLRVADKRMYEAKRLYAASQRSSR